MCEWGGGRAEVAATEARSPRHRSSRRPCRRAWTAAWSSPPAADTRRGTLGGSSRRFPSERRSCAGGRVGVAENDSKAAARDVGRWSLRGGRLLARGAPLGGGGVREQAHRQWRADVDSPASPESPGGLVCPVGRHERCSFGPKKKGVRAGRTWGGLCGARPWSSGSYGSGVLRHACGGCARARGRRGGGELRGVTNPEE